MGRLSDVRTILGDPVVADFYGGHGGVLVVDATAGAERMFILNSAGEPVDMSAGSGKTLKTVAVSISATGTVIAAVSAKRLKVYAVKLICSAALSIKFRDGASTNLEGAQDFVANGGVAESVTPPEFLFATTAGNSLDLVITGTGTVSGRLSYWDDDAT